MLKLRLLLCLLCFSGMLVGQNSYNISSIPFNPDPFNAGTASGVNIDDFWSGVVTLPFSFCFHGQSYDKLVIGSNGVVSFDTTNALMYCPWPIGNPVPNSSMPNLSIMAPIQDIDPSVGGSIKYDVRGVAPYRRFIVSYYQVPMFSCNSLLFSEQVILYETSNIIETHILDKPLCTSWNNGAAVHGIQVDPSVGYVVTGRNFPTQWATQSDGYRFTPVGVCAGQAPADSIYGKAYTDYNNNCTKDANEFPITGRAILANGGQYYGWTNASGDYGMGLASGSYSVSEQTTLPFFSNHCVPGGAYSLTLSGNVLTGIDFPDSAASICSDITVGIGTYGLRRCGYSPVFVTYCNDGTYPDSSVVVTVTLNDSLSLDSASMAYTSLGGNMYSFSVGHLMPGQCGYIALHCGAGCDSAGTIYCMMADIAGTYPVQCDTTNDSDTECVALMAPYDPNDKVVASQNFAQNGYVRSENIDADDELTYVIHFQNLGTVYAEDVEIRDTLDPALAPETIQMGAASAAYNYYVQGNALLVRFENIFLPDSATNEPGSHGFVKFSIRQRPGNPLGTVIENQASIHFDAEAPVVTPQTVNTIAATNVGHPVWKDLVQVYPNPGHDLLVVQRNQDQEMTFVMYDIAGREVRRTVLGQSKTTIHTNDLQQGLYLYQVQSEGQTVEAGKWMKQ